MRGLLFVVVGIGVLAGSAAGATTEDITLVARPNVARADQGLTLSGSVAGARVGDTIDIQARDCGQRSFSNAGGAHVGAGGAWSTEFFPGINTTLRAVWRGRVSATVAVRQHATVRLRSLPSSPKRFEVAVVAKTPFWRKRVLFQRLAGTWKTVKPVLLTEQLARPGATAVWSTGQFRTTLPRGTRVRVLLPLAQAQPCYLDGASRLLRVG